MVQEEVDSWLRCIEIEYKYGDLTREEYLKERKFYLGLLDSKEVDNAQALDSSSTTSGND